MNEMRPIKCTIFRGGTSKGLYFLKNDLPSNPELRDRVLLSIFGSPDKRQIDGLGGADPLTSKLAIVSPSKEKGIDIEYTFGQVAIEEAKIFYQSMCGNITSGVGPFAINAGIVDAKEGITKVVMRNTNTGKKVIAEVPVKNGKASCVGDYEIAGVSGTSAKILMDMAGTAGALTGSLLPTGNVKDILTVPGVGKVEVSIVDCGACQIYVRAKDLGLKGIEEPKELDSQPDLLKKIEAIRAYATHVIGLTDTPNSASEVRRNTPHIALIAESQGYKNFQNGELIPEGSVDFVARMLFMQIMHKTYAGTGSIAISVASQIPGTIVNDAIKSIDMNKGYIRFGHPSGVIEVEVDVTKNENQYVVNRAAIGRTARMIMEGYVYVRESVFENYGW
ncbi:3-methylitaconate isomerase [Bacillus timonensis]|uniref:3-methylitaconate isomerase n=1 Tax=Bacillus timonensis TaxID=1033734 RepID=A0A4S3PKR6_9BACI|nr:PrpF domain-containing protein [Bacillus timonensis]THE09918.1 3-methylitaconate isomerase [Bacillus timonensis]